MDVATLSKLQKEINYKFTNLNLLNNTFYKILDNETNEFYTIGNYILEFIVSKKIIVSNQNFTTCKFNGNVQSLLKNSNISKLFLSKQSKDLPYDHCLVDIKGYGMLNYLIGDNACIINDIGILTPLNRTNEMYHSAKCKLCKVGEERTSTEFIIATIYKKVIGAITVDSNFNFDVLEQIISNTIQFN